jgi:hypothetical protein
VIINRSEKKNKRAETVAILNSFNNFNNFNNNNTTSKNKNEGKKISQLSYGVSNKMRKSSQHKYYQPEE